jgi:uncharacterized DUF497 family protein
MPEEKQALHAALSAKRKNAQCLRFSMKCPPELKPQSRLYLKKAFHARFCFKAISNLPFFASSGVRRKNHSLQKPLAGAICCVYNNAVEHEFDGAKDASNMEKHGLSLAEAVFFEWETALVREDMRKAYAERRFEAVGYVGKRLCVMVFCLRPGAIRIISLRRANMREEKRYAEIEA